MAGRVIKGSIFAVFGFLLVTQCSVTEGGSVEKRFLSCIAVGEECWGVARCCGSAVCHWERGYSLAEYGRCVDCVKEGGKCQRDAQCCSPQVCQKDKMYHLNGVCGAKRAAGSMCHENDQCESGRCDKKWWQIAEGQCE